VSRNVTVHEPSTGIICLECNHDEAVHWKQHNVTTGRVVKLETEFVLVEYLALFLLKDSEVVTV